MSAAKSDCGKKTLFPTICLAIGMLIGGTIGAAVGVLFRSETAVVLCYIAGALGGATTGAMLGWRWCSRGRDAA